MEWAAILRDLVIGLLVAGAAAAWIPDRFWQHLFLADHPLAAKVVGPLVGPLVAVVTFVCSIGNVPLAAVLWNGGISFGGVISFIFADLIIVPILLIYRRYYGARTAWLLFGTFYATMAAAGYVIELVFAPLGLIPTGAAARPHRRRRDQLELHDRAEHRVPADRGRPRVAVLHHRRTGDARDDGRLTRCRARSARPTTAAMPTMTHHGSALSADPGSLPACNLRRPADDLTLALPDGRRRRRDHDGPLRRGRPGRRRQARPDAGQRRRPGGRADDPRRTWPANVRTTRCSARSSARRARRPRRWVIDPIDGTKNFVRGVPVWATLIALLDGDQPVARRGVGAGARPALVGGARRTGRGWRRSARRPGGSPVSKVARLGRRQPVLRLVVGLDRSRAGRRVHRADPAGAGARRAYGDFWSYMLRRRGSGRPGRRARAGAVGHGRARRRSSPRPAGGSPGWTAVPGPFQGSAAASNGHPARPLLTR